MLKCCICGDVGGKGMNAYHLQEIEAEYRDALTGLNHPDEGAYCQGVVRGVNTVMGQLGYVWRDDVFKKEREVEE